MPRGKTRRPLKRRKWAEDTPKGIIPETVKRWLRGKTEEEKWISRN